jgi:hypothetical protein
MTTVGRRGVQITVDKPVPDKTVEIAAVARLQAVALIRHPEQASQATMIPLAVLDRREAIPAARPIPVGATTTVTHLATLVHPETITVHPETITVHPVTAMDLQ